jgi:hypothetical protein
MRNIGPLTAWLAVIIGLSAAPAVPAGADAGMNIGTLTCRVASGWDSCWVLRALSPASL